MTGAKHLRERDLELLVARAQAGDRNALEAVVRTVQPDVYGLALRFLWHPLSATGHFVDSNAQL